MGTGGREEERTRIGEAERDGVVSRVWFAGKDCRASADEKDGVGGHEEETKRTKNKLGTHREDTLEGDRETHPCNFPRGFNERVIIVGSQGKQAAHRNRPAKQLPRSTHVAVPKQREAQRRLSPLRDGPTVRLPRQSYLAASRMAIQNDSVRLQFRKMCPRTSTLRTLAWGTAPRISTRSCSWLFSRISSRRSLFGPSPPMMKWRFG